MVDAVFEELAGEDPVFRRLVRKRHADGRPGRGDVDPVVVGEQQQEFLELRYHGEDKLFVPVENIDVLWLNG